MIVVDPGHRYQLLTLDGKEEQFLQFVKREGMLYPGNIGSSSGTNLQSVLRACLDRVTYLQNQSYCAENQIIEENIRACIWLLESRAARRHNLNYNYGTIFASLGPMCKKCGHTMCLHNQENGGT